MALFVESDVKCQPNNQPVHYLSCLAARRTAYLNFFYGQMRKGLKGPGRGLKGWGLHRGLQIFAGLHHCEIKPDSVFSPSVIPSQLL